MTAVHRARPRPARHSRIESAGRALVLVLAVLVAGPLPAAAGVPCPASGDLAPGSLIGSGPGLAWQVIGDGQMTVADIVAATIIATTGASVTGPGGCAPPVDPAPGLDDRRARTFAPMGDRAWTACDAEALLGLALARRSLTTDASDYPGAATSAVPGIAALDSAPPISDDALLEALAPLLEQLDAGPRGEAVFHAWLELQVLGDCFPLPESVSLPATAAASQQTLLARIEATMAWQVLKEFVSTVVFAFVPEPIAVTVQAADPAMFIALSHAAVRKNIVQAHADGTITTEQLIELRGMTAQNPYQAQRRLLEMQGRPIPDWLQAAPPSCLHRCTAEACSNGFDDDGDTLVDCADSNCAANPACVESLCANGIDDDRDGYADCADSDCFGKPACVESLCANGIDDDRDGATDCADSDCEGTGACFESACSNGVDDDHDGATDCADSDCAGTGACAEADCSNGADDDGDGFIDCDDADCQLAGHCQPAVYCGCWFDSTSPNVNNWVWRCHQQSSPNFSPPYTEIWNEGPCDCRPEIYTVCE